ncbi:MAG: hypothetical protein P8Z68_00820 [Kineosporiaceae bacterium]
MPRFPIRLAVLATAFVLLSGCAGDPAGTSRPADTGTHPVVTGAQARIVLDEVAAAVDEVAAGTVPPTDSPRVVGPVRAQFAAQLRVPARLRAVPVGAQTWQRVLVPSSSGWPRWFVAVGSTPKRSTPVVSVLRSTAAQDPYGLWAQLILLPGQALPEVAPAGEGAQELAGDATGLMLTPEEVATRYADLLTRGSHSASAALFAPDLLRTQVTAQVVADRKELDGLATVTVTHRASGGPVLALGTSDGGALVVAELTETYRLEKEAAADKLGIGDPALAALAGRSSFGTEVVRTSQELVAFVIPPDSVAHGQIRVVAAGKVDVAVRGR